MASQLNYHVEASIGFRSLRCFSLSTSFKRVFVSYNNQTAYFSGNTANAAMIASTGKPELELVTTSNNIIPVTFIAMSSNLAHGIGGAFPNALDFGQPIFNTKLKNNREWKIECFNPQTKLPECFITVFVTFFVQ